MAKLLKTTGEIITIEPKNGTDFSAEELNKLVGGHFEILPLKNGYMVIHEEGKLIGLPTNQLATAIFHHDLIVGSAIICSKENIK